MILLVLIFHNFIMNKIYYDNKHNGNIWTKKYTESGIEIKVVEVGINED